jgi:hypothetical protein
MSKYSNDPRVVLHADGTATLPDPGGYDGEPSGDWEVRRGGGGFEVHNVPNAQGRGGDQGFVYDDGAWYASRSWVPVVFASVDEAIEHVIGDPE